MIAARWVTGVIGGALLLGALYWGGLPFFLVFLGITLVGQKEFYALARLSGYPSMPVLGMVGGALVLISVFTSGISFGALSDYQATPALVAALLVAMVIWSVLRGQRDTVLSEWGMTLLGILWIAGAMAHLVMLRDLKPSGFPATLLLFLVIWAGDTGAYFVGRQWGKHPLAASISPKKTWEGLVGGLVCAGLVGVIVQAVYLKSQLTPLEAILLSVTTAALATFSDLSESLVKRAAGEKDSSQLLPGHGGILDRFDSFLLTAPIYYYYWAFFKH